MIKAVLFDMDGVLYNSMPSHVCAWRETMQKIGIETSIEDFYLFEGRTGHSTINILFNHAFGRDATPQEVETLYAQKAQRFAELEYPESKPMPGALEVLETVKYLGWQRIIVTGSGQLTLLDKLDKHFPGFFDKDQMVTAYDVKYGKPHPEPYQIGLKKGNLTAKEAIVIENAPLGIESARAAGIYTIAVNTGPLSNEILLKSGANVVYSSMKELALALDRRFKRL
jgi:HAD superfamily hydrolase (TIGR01509 family)